MDEFEKGLMEDYVVPSITNGICLGCGVPAPLPGVHEGWHYSEELALRILQHEQGEIFASVIQETKSLVEDLLPAMGAIIDTNFGEIVTALNTGQATEIQLLSIPSGQQRSTWELDKISQQLKWLREMVNRLEVKAPTPVIEEHKVIAKGHLPLTREILQRQILSSIEKIWGMHPDMPFSHLILNATDVQMPSEMFYLEDAQLNDALQRLL